MCGRYQFMTEEDNAEISRILKRINEKYHGKVLYSTGEIRPTNIVPVITQADCNLMSWGLPKWDGKGVIINARSETANEKKMFTGSLQERRCVIPALGFYEWQKKDPSKPKDKFFFQTDEQPLMYMAGIYNIFQGNKEVKEHFAILTRDANIFMSDIHDRMPIVLYQNEIDKWLYDKNFIDFAFQRENVVLKRKAVQG